MRTYFYLQLIDSLRTIIIIVIIIILMVTWHKKNHY